MRREKKEKREGNVLRRKKKGEAKKNVVMREQGGKTRMREINKWARQENKITKKRERGDGGEQKRTEKGKYSRKK